METSPAPPPEPPKTITNGYQSSVMQTDLIAPAPVLELLGGNILPLSKDPFYGQLFKAMRKKRKKEQKKKAKTEADKSVKMERTMSTSSKSSVKRELSEAHDVPWGVEKVKIKEVKRQKDKKVKVEKEPTNSQHERIPNGDVSAMKKKDTAATLRAVSKQTTPSNSRSSSPSAGSRAEKKARKKEKRSNLASTRHEQTPMNISYNYCSNEADKTVNNFNFLNPAFRNFVHIDTDANGKATTLHAYIPEIEKFFNEKKYSESQKTEFMDGFQYDFAKLAVHERHLGEPYFVLSVIHGCANNLPDPLTSYAKEFPNANVKIEAIGNNKSVQTMTLKEYFKRCRDNYNSMNGTVRMGPLRAISMVGKTGEEVSLYSEEYIDKLEDIPILKAALPWGTMSQYSNTLPKNSNDGPILWVRPGEQLTVASSVDHVQALKRRSRLVIGRGEDSSRSGSKELYEPAQQRRHGGRESAIEDWTPAHADHVEEPHLRQTGWAVGVLKHTDYYRRGQGGPKRAVKRVIAFDARSFYDVTEPLELNLFGNPQSQCTKYICHKRLNYLRSLGCKYSEFDLYEDDIYIIPRHVVHQFRSIAHVTSLAWHVRLRDMHLQDGHGLEEMTSIMRRHYEKRSKQLINVFEQDKGNFFSSDSEEEDEDTEEDENLDDTEASQDESSVMDTSNSSQSTTTTENPTPSPPKLAKLKNSPMPGSPLKRESSATSGVSTVERVPSSPSKPKKQKVLSL